MKINIKGLALLLLCGSYSAHAALNIDNVNDVVGTFKDAAQGHTNGSELKMNNRSVIIGTKDYKKNQQNHLDFYKSAING